MKKAAISVIAVGAAICILLFAAPWFLPNLVLSEKTLALGSGGNVYLAENRSLASFVYACDKKGRVASVYWEPAESGGKHTAITKLAADGSKLYFLRLTGSTSSGRFAGWEISALDTGANTASFVYKGSTSLAAPDGMSAKDGVVYLTFLKSGGARALVYQLDTKKKDLSLDPAGDITAPKGTNIVSASYGDGILYCLLDNGRLCWYEDSGGPSYYPPEKNSFVSAYSVSGDGAWISAGGGVSCGSGSLLSETARIPQGYSVSAGISDGKNRMVLKATDQDGTGVLLMRDAEAFGTVSILDFSPSARMAFKLPYFLAMLPLFLTALALAVFCVLAVHKSRRLAMRLIAYSACGAYLLLCLTGALLLNESREDLRQSLESVAEAAGHTRAAAIEQTDFSRIGTEKFYGSGAYGRIRNILTPTDAGETAVSGELISLGADDPAMAAAVGLPTGEPLRIAYDASTADAVIGAAKDGSARKLTVSLQGIRTAVDIRPLDLNGRHTALLLTRVSRESAQARQLSSLYGTLTALGVMLLVTLLVIWLLALRVTRPMKQIVGQMNRLSEGNLQLGQVKAGPNEVGDMWQAMQEMAVSVGIKEYEMNSTVRSFYRFVPRGLEKLLHRASVTEVSFGDMTKVKSAVAILSVNNRDDVRGALDDGQFMNFVNTCFSSIDRHVGANKGLLLTGDFDLGGLKSAFPGSADDGVAFGLGLLGEPAKNPSAPPEYFILLHTTEFLYGVAGTQDQAFAFLSSAELDFLGALSDNFRGTGVRLAATEACLNSLQRPCTSRYIGFVSSKDGRFIYKMYEILDVYSSAEKAQRLALDEKLQEGIRLFYKNDFYLARNIFSAILKANPEDGIARWYLFASEHFFNIGKPEEAVYNLFGIRE